jgi:serine/threonine protein kinase
MFIVSEYMAKGTLTAFLRQFYDINASNFINREMSNFMDLRSLFKFCRDISAGMKWLHSLGIIHRQIIFLSSIRCHKINLLAGISKD